MVEFTLTGAADEASGNWIKDTSTQDFMVDVIEASRHVPVVVDFWAPWCGPCKQLTPVIEKVVNAAKGKVRLVKLNIDEHPMIPQQMGVQSIPAVFAFKDGRPIDGFMGAQPESEVKRFIEALAGGAVEDDDGGIAEALEAAAGLRDAGDVAQAAQLFGAVLAREPQNTEAVAGLARCHIDAGNLDQAEHTLAMVPETETGAELDAARSALDLARKSAEAAGDIEQLHAAVDAHPDDHAARLKFALALAAEGRKGESVDQLIEIMRRDRTWDDDAARKQLVEFFEVWGPSDPDTIEGRRKLSLLLFS